jgi:hypothetical protein
MKKLLLSLVLAGSVFGFGNSGMQNSWFSTMLNQYPVEALSNAEKNALLHMAEEEKLARDVYTTLYNKWGLRVFGNIKKAEQHHMNMVDMLLKRYGMKINNLPVGEFHDSKVQELYNKLVNMGSKSRVDALKVGALIEDLDIYDLEKYMKEVDNKDILFIFKNLTKGSRNHMRAFIGWLKTYKATYSPQYISYNEFNNIINSPFERGIVK